MKNSSINSDIVLLIATKTITIGDYYFNDYFYIFLH